ncbi:MAG: tyrosine-type recombinase/integrase [Nitrososphaeria archaeon]|nr:tyrosine-type recombinase/integrase [Nitrososphaeria archaeon]NIN51812.1 tyrosine-type recombinase/integrase [Nitrososphaeria archaeon]NIQ32344.1 tyrosine-type recombinase/integrase [Nitrososphaeria archaeon]
MELRQVFWKRLRARRRGTRALTLDKVPSNEEFRKIITHMPIQGKALYLMLAASGMRIGEALQLRLEDIELDSDPVKVKIRGEYTKTGNPRIAFVSSEAREAVEEWLKTREEYIGRAVGRSHRYEKASEDDRLFPFLDSTAYIMWKNALKKTRNHEKDPSTKRLRVHPHVLRKFFRTKMGTMVPVDVAEALMGHEGYLTALYRKYSDEDLARFYRQGEPSLLVFTESGEISKIKQEIDERNRQLQTLVNGLTAENLELKARVAKTELAITDVVKDIDELKKLVAKSLS